MFDIFLKKVMNINYPINIYSSFSYIKTKYKEQLAILRKYYSNKEYSVDNTNIISRLILTLTPDVNMNIYDYLTQVSASAIFISKQFNIVSNINKGAVLNNIFFDKSSREVFLYTEDMVDVDYVANNWRDIVTLKVIYCEENDFNFRLPYFQYHNSDSSYDKLYVMTIDIINMMLQYRYWCLDRVANNLSTEPTYFVAKILIPNMLGNMLDISIYNRVININYKIKNTRFKNYHPFAITEYSVRIDKVLTKLVHDYKNTPAPLGQFLMSIPTIYNDNMVKALYIDHRYYTVQSEWVLWLSRLGVIVDSLELLGKRGLGRNTDILSGVLFKVKQFTRSTTIDNMLNSSPVISSEFDMNIDKLINFIKEK